MRVKGEDGGDGRWEDGDNRSLVVPAGGASSLSVLLEWGGEMHVQAAGAGEELPGLEGAHQQQREREWERSRSGSGSDSDDSWAPPSSGGSGSSFDDSMALLPQWQGKELRFMQSNEHSRWGRGQGGGWDVWVGWT